MARRHRIIYKFTEKKQSKRGICALALALLSAGALVAVVAVSFVNRGEGNLYLGSAGVASMLLAVLAFFLSIKSLGEENSYKLFPYLSTSVSFLMAGLWIALYVAGIYG